MDQDASPLDSSDEELICDEDIEKQEQTENRTVVFEMVKAPEPGMTFLSLDALVDYYKKYGKQEGFRVSRKSRTISSSGKIEHVTIACSREGKPYIYKRNVLQPKPTTKTGCKARVNATLFDNGSCRINSVRLEHSHPLVPRRSRFCICNRDLPIGVQRKLELNGIEGSGVIRTDRPCSVQAGDYENASTLEKECKNSLEKPRQFWLSVGDAEAIFDYFIRMKSKNSSFFYAMDIDEESRIKNVFWADARSRAAYEEFGDVVMIDTTYLANKYDMPFVPFIGVNHHGQSILFGCGLLSNEETVTFAWLFRAFLSCMPESSPNAIITDQDKALQEAIEIVFPGIHHRWCLWHIMKKLPEKLKGYRMYEEIKKIMQNAVYDSSTKEEFEESWSKFIEKFNLYDNAWLKGLYEERHRWVPVFVKDYFWAGMSITQRNQKMTPFFDGLVYSKTTMKQFIEQYDIALESKVEKEDRADLQSFNSWVPCVTHFELEKQFQQIYTIDKFKEFQQEMVAKLYCDVTLVGETNGTSEYDVSEDVVVGDDEEQHHKLVHFKVHLVDSDYDVQCTCCSFEFRGIICRHMISVLVKKQICNVSSKYILPRWRKDLKRRYTKVKVGYCGWSNNPKAQRYDYIYKKFDEAADMAVESDEYCEMLWSCIDDYQKRINRSDVDDKDSQLPSERLTIENRLLSPLALRRQGRPPTKRKASKVEQTIKKQLQHKKKGQSSGRRHDQQVPQTHQDIGPPTYPSNIVGENTQSLTDIATQESIFQANAAYGQYSGQVLNMQHVSSSPLLLAPVQGTSDIRGPSWTQQGVTDYPIRGYNDNK
ncbi:protein FAR1-RELATED SEQUENCE 6 isoform X1 [Canna indica]|uniref:Protein FAR1-RELATED SEQUENCE n=1 Tax=Canna indica TaxID=4628 RepID=A0AAQ3JS19_9LILI|nr:protein FAR1-RELATED SEQUENCE 6 isoform X1 [Canna indica]